MVEFELPIELIEHIQSFLDDGEVANRTCLLSKSWYKAWSTRPNLVFRSFWLGDRNKYYSNKEHDGFWDYTLRTINRYKESNLRIHKLVIAIGNNRVCTSPIHELIADVSALGVTELDYMAQHTHEDFPDQVFDITSLTKLSIYNPEIYQLDSRVLCSGLVSLKLRDVYIDYRVIRRILLRCPLIQSLVLHNVSSSKNIYNDDGDDNAVLCPSLVSLGLFGYQQRGLIEVILSGRPLIENLELREYCIEEIPLPHQVWAARSFKSLSISDCTIHNCIIQTTNYLSLTFRHTYIQDDVIRDILLRCPLIENLHLEEPQGLSRINVSNLRNLVSLSILVNWHKHNHISLSFQSIRSGSSVLKFKKLRLLSLKGVNVDHEFFNKFSARFPCVEDVALCFSGGHKEIRISSRSVKYLKLHHSGTLQKAEFIVPNIRTFVYNGKNVIPLLSFHTRSSDWESKVKLRFPSSPHVDVESFSPTLPAVTDSCWFIKLREFLNELSQSRISFRIKVDESKLIWVKDLPSSLTPVVENLTIDNYCSSQTKAYLCALLGCCRPTLITLNCPQYLLIYSFAQILHEILIYQDTMHISRVQSSLMYDLEEIDVELYERSKWQRQTIPLTKFLEDGPIILLDEERVRFRFKWGAFKCT